MLTKQQVRRGVYQYVPELIAAIGYYIEGYNKRAQPFLWTKTADGILSKASKQQATSRTPIRETRRRLVASTGCPARDWGGFSSCVPKRFDRAVVGRRLF
jgi:hypothetical protein